MSTHDSWPNPAAPADDTPARPFPVLLGVICTVLIALECVVVGPIYMLSAKQWTPDETLTASVPQADLDAFRTAITVCGAIGLVVAVLLVIGAIRILAARRAWRAGVVVLLVLNAIFPNAIAIAAQTPILALLVIVDIVGVVCLVLPDTSAWLREHRAPPAR